MATGNKPTYRAFSVVDIEGDKSRWIDIGAAFVHEDGKGYNIVLHAIPVNGKLVLRLNEPKPKE